MLLVNNNRSPLQGAFRVPDAALRALGVSLVGNPRMVVKVKEVSLLPGEKGAEPGHSRG